MNLKSIILAGATALSLAVPAGALAQPWDRGWHDRDDWRREEWREHERREHDRHERWEHRGYGYGYGYGYAPRCFVEDRGYHDWYGRWVYRPVRICR